MFMSEAFERSFTCEKQSSAVEVINCWFKKEVTISLCDEK